MAGHRSLYEYRAEWQIHALDWRKDDERKQLAIGSFIEREDNKIRVIELEDNDDGYSRQGPANDFKVKAEYKVHYPLTKVLWKPFKTNENTSILATTSDVLRTWELVENKHYGYQSNSIHRSNARHTSDHPYQLEKKAELRKHEEGRIAPLTSFDWNEQDPSMVVTASIDTTCTVWNVETNQAKTQLIAHDAEVFDVAYKPDSTDIFSTVSMDGSVRLFDTRTLEHSTILYEAPPLTGQGRDHGQPSPTGKENALLRVQFSPINSHLIATFQFNASTVQILDLRAPTAPVAELNEGHQASVNHMAWSPRKPKICTCGDDAQALIWDLQSLNTKSSPKPTPVQKYVAKAPITSLSWNKRRPEWIGVCFDDTIQALSYRDGPSDIHATTDQYVGMT